MWGQGTRGGAHVEHEAKLRDAGRVEGHRLVERRRGLPSGRACDTGREVCGPERGGGSWGVGQGRARKRDAHAEEPRLGAGHAPAAERTWNTPFM